MVLVNSKINLEKNFQKYYIKELILDKYINILNKLELKLTTIVSIYRYKNL